MVSAGCSRGSGATQPSGDRAVRKPGIGTQQEMEMFKYNGFLYGHYDRGGSVFVIAGTREEADRKYTREFWGEDQDGEFEDAADEDFLGEGFIESPVIMGVGGKTQEISEGDDTVYDDDSVRISGTCTVLKGHEGGFDNFPEDGGPFELLYVPNGPIPEGYAEPRWSDAFGLLLVP